MNGEAVKQIQETSGIPEVIKQLSALKGVALVPDGMALRSTQEFGEVATHYVQSFVTSSIPDFIEYNEKFGSEHATCFVDSDEMKARTIFDLGEPLTPGHKKHDARFVTKQTAAFTDLLDIVNQNLSQKKAAEFIESWGDIIKVSSVSGSMPTAEAAKSIRDMTIDSARSVSSQVSDFGAKMSAMEEIEARNKDKIPAEFVFSCVPFWGFESRKILVKISIITGEEKPMLNFRVFLKEKLMEDLGEELKEIFVNGLQESGIDLFIGRVV